MALGLAAQMAIGPGMMAQDLERTSKIIERALTLPEGAAVEVKTLNKKKLRGRVAEIGEESMTVQTTDGAAVHRETLHYSDIQSLKRTDKPMSPAKAALVTLGVLYAVGLVIGLIVGG